jgi:transcriptional regulator
MGGHGVDLPQGTLDLLILRALALEPKYGWAIADRIHQISRQAIEVPQGSLYPALHRLERRGWIRGQWGVADTGRRAKTYELTAKGRRQLAAETDAWKQLTAAVALIIENA